MAASDHLQGKQLSMFMTPSDIKSQYGPGDADAYKSTDAMWEHRRQTAEEPDEGFQHGSLAGSIRAKGVTEPIELVDSPKLIGDGHHRLSVADPDKLVPVIHHATYDSFQADEGNWHGRYSGPGYEED